MLEDPDKKSRGLSLLTDILQHMGQQIALGWGIKLTKQQEKQVLNHLINLLPENHPFKEGLGYEPSLEDYLEETEEPRLSVQTSGNLTHRIEDKVVVATSSTLTTYSYSSVIFPKLPEVLEEERTFIEELGALVHVTPGWAVSVCSF